MKIVQNKVIPLLLAKQGDDRVAYQVAKLLVMLTLPQTEITGRPFENRILVDYADHLAQNGAAINIFLCQLPLDPTQVPTEKATLTMELVLTLFRNLLCIQNEKPTGSGLSSRCQVHEELLITFEKELVLFSIVELASLVSSPQFQQVC